MTSARRRRRQRALDGRATVFDPLVIRSLHARFDVVENSLGIFGARIVARHDREIGLSLGDAAHLRTLALVAIAAAAEHDDQSLRA